MTAIRGALGAVGEQMSAEDAPGLEASAATIVDGMSKARSYWQTRDRRALRYAISSQRAAQGFHSAAAAGDFEAAGVAFGALREERALAFLESCLDTDWKEMRAEAVVALSRLDHPRARNLVSEAQQDKAGKVRRIAEKALAGH